VYLTAEKSNEAEKRASPGFIGTEPLAVKMSALIRRKNNEYDKKYKQRPECDRRNLHRFAVAFFFLRFAQRLDGLAFRHAASLL
jgi:hypothetical protein